MKRCTMALVAATLVVAFALAGSAQAVTVDWVGGIGTWFLDSPWDAGGGAVTAQTAFGGRNGWAAGDAGAPVDPDIVIGAGDDVWYGVFDASVIPVEKSDWRMDQDTPANGGSLTIRDGGKFTLNSSEDVDGEWSQFDADSVTVTGAGSLLKKTFNSTDPRANSPGLSNSGGAFTFGSFRADDDQTIAINVADGGRFEVDGQLQFGYWDRIDATGAPGSLDITMTISDQSHVALTGGDNEDILGAAGGFGNADLILNRTWDDLADTPLAGDYIINFIGHGGSLSVDHSGIIMPVQVSDGSDPGFGYDFDTLADPNTGLPALVTFQDLYNGADRGVAGPTPTDVPAGTLRASGSFAAAFGNVFYVTGSSGSDGYKVTSIQGAADGGAQRSDINGDMFVDGADAQILIPNLNTGDGSGTDVFLSQGNIVPDPFIDGFDAQKMFADLNNAYDAGPAAAGEVQAEYDKFSGKISVSVGDNILSWFIQSLTDQDGIVGGMTGPDDAADALPAGGGTYAGNILRVGETKFSSALDPYDANLGQIAAPGLEDVLLFFTRADGSQVNGAPVNVVPEPASLMLIGLGLCGVLAFRRRLAA